MPPDIGFTSDARKAMADKIIRLQLCDLVSYRAN